MHENVHDYLYDYIICFNSWRVLYNDYPHRNKNINVFSFNVSIDLVFVFNVYKKLSMTIYF